MLPLPKGIIISFCVGTDGSHTAVGYKSVSFEDGRLSTVTADTYMMEKFGYERKDAINEADNPVTCLTAHLANGELAVISQNGDTKLLDKDGLVRWQGNLCFKGTAPTGLTAVGRRMWVAYSDANAVVRYNAATLKPELRIGGGKEPVFLGPEGIWISNNKITVCCTGDNKLCRIDLDTFGFEDYERFTEPVHQYFSIGGYELVRLDSGIYLL